MSDKTAFMSELQMSFPLAKLSVLSETRGFGVELEFPTDTIRVFYSDNRAAGDEAMENGYDLSLFGNVPLSYSLEDARNLAVAIKSAMLVAASQRETDS